MKAEDLGWKLKMDPAKVKDQAGHGDKLIPAASIEINIVKFLESRSREMEAMRQSAALVSTNARVMQQLPRHMRRRAASHNVKRLPRHLRLEAEKELKKSGGPAVAAKRPSRRHRRRPRRLLDEYERRKRRHVWLETHIWHAKRFHMAEMWGYKIPLHLNDRGIRAAYRDTVNRCLIFDLSYYCCIEVSGNRETLLTTLSRFTSPDIAPSFASQKYARGTREGQTTLYRHDSYPFHALGEVRFLWKARPDSSDASTDLWIWTHPSAHGIILTELKRVFQPVENIGHGRDVAVNSVVVTSLKDRLCRFRLVGPQSQQILRRVFVPARFSDSNPAENQNQDVPPWWWNLTGEHGLFERQAEAWKRMECLHSTSDLLPNSIYGLVVRDPRVAGQLKKQTIFESRCAKQQSGNLESWISASPLWDREVRESVKGNMMKTAEINSLKSNHLVPGSPLDLGSKESRIPVLFIQNPGASGTDAPLSRLGYGSGWDVVLPAGWSLPFWIALGHCEAHAAGLEELRHVDFEQSELHFPDHFPDTPSGADVNLSCYVKAVEKYDRIPPAKRINYKKLKVETPFHFPWKELVDGWKDPGYSSVSVVMDGFCCLRSRCFLQFLQKLVNGCCQPLGKRRVSENDASLEAASQKLQVIRNDPYLVPVHLVMCSRGVSGKFSMICVPEDDDLTQYTKSPKQPGLVNELGCKRTRNTTKPNKRKRGEPCVAEPISKKSRLELDNIVTSGSTDGRLGNDIKIISSGGVCLEHSAELSEHASNLPDEVLSKDVKKSLPYVADVVNSCSRKILGYVVTDSGLAYTKGLGASLGFVSLQGLLSLIERQKVYVCRNANDEKANSSFGNSTTLSGVLVLVRSTRCGHYRFARLNILQKI